MRIFLSIFCFIALSAPGIRAQTTSIEGVVTRAIIVNGDTIPYFNALPVYIFSKPLDTRKNQRLIRNLKIVYPIAKRAEELLRQAQIKLESISSKKERKKYMKDMEDQLKREYTPILKKMTYSQGKLLIKLIDRQTDNTSYDLIKDLRGSFSAFLWQGVARLFGANLKDTYDGKGDEKFIEQLIIYYEAGLI